LLFEVLYFVFDGVCAVEVFALDAEGLVGFEEVDHLFDFFAVQVLLVLEGAEAAQKHGGLGHVLPFLGGHVVSLYK
jgi:hypothetical protein